MSKLSKHGIAMIVLWNTNEDSSLGNELEPSNNSLLDMIQN